MRQPEPLTFLILLFACRLVEAGGLPVWSYHAHHIPRYVPYRSADAKDPRIYRFPLNSCESAKRWVIDRFQKTAKKQILSAECFEELPVFPGSLGDNVAKHYFNVTLKYLSDEPLHLETTDPDSLHMNPAGWYHGQDECDRDLFLTQIPMFRKATGLEPALAYCYQDIFIPNNRMWIPKIDGFGKTRVHPQQFTQLISFGTNIAHESELLALIKKHLEKRKIPVASIFIRKDTLGLQHLEILYYAHARIGLKHWRMEVLKYTDCSRQLAYANHIMNASGIEPVALYCAYESGPMMRLLTFDRLVEKIDPIEVDYPNFESCIAARAKMMALYQSQTHEKPEGILCGSGGTSTHSMYVFKRAED